MPSLSEDIIEILNDNGFQKNKLIVSDKKIVSSYEYLTQLSIQLTRNTKTQIVNGKPNSGCACKVSSDAQRLARASGDVIVNSLFNSVRQANSTILASNVFSSQETGKSFYTSEKCPNCGGQGRKACSECSGGGKSRCNSCSGTGSHSCSYCNGNGKMICSSCNGAGSHTEYSHSFDDNGWESLLKSHGGTVNRKCNNCSGGWNFCNHCSGRGKASCSTCDGDGINTCNSCFGTGKTTCVGCDGAGEKSSVVFEVVDVSTKRTNVSLSDHEPLCRRSLEKALDQLFAGSKITQIELISQESANPSNWSIISTTKKESFCI